MKTLSTQSETSDSTAPVLSQLLNSEAHSSASRAAKSETASLELPNFNALAAVQSHSLRLAARLNAASISEEEHKGLLKQRQVLLDKKFEGQITPSELNKLEYIRWSLDRIEDAKYGSALDALENSVSRYENFISEIKSLSSQLLHHSKKKK